MKTDVFVHLEMKGACASVGSLKLWVSFAEYRLFCRVVLAEETYDFKEPTNRSHHEYCRVFAPVNEYEVVLVSRIDEIVGLFCRIASLLSGSFAKETYDFIDPTNRSHPVLM